MPMGNIGIRIKYMINITWQVLVEGSVEGLEMVSVLIMELVHMMSDMCQKLMVIYVLLIQLTFRVRPFKDRKAKLIQKRVLGLLASNEVGGQMTI
ncbi:uncharacterized protein LOC131438288 isoform X5 [Malaya genurostris]|uniref:uncharacterized protein LOC131438288 isoform X5 n=1 Tax=Malaya genurostris TaxID=325434 RepID=UPI0026F3D2A8|nr:uncharacterized protein LOC131438288 isoform X5 [Malaya genurostris]